MRNLTIWKSLALIIFCLGLSEAVNCQTTDDFGGPIKKLLTEYDQAWNRKDAKSVEKFLAPNYIYFSSTGGTISRQRTLEFLASPRYIIKSAKRTELAAYSAANTLIVSSRWIGNGTYNGRGFQRRSEMQPRFHKRKRLVEAFVRALHPDRHEIRYDSKSSARVRNVGRIRRRS